MLVDAGRSTSSGADMGESDACNALKLRLGDVKHLSSEITKLDGRIREVKGVTKEFMELSQSFWNTVLAFLVAIWVPLSFASSYYGMNITDIDPTPYWSNKTTVDVSPPITRNITSHDLIGSDAPGNKSWSTSTFWITALPLVIATLVVPFVAGALVRLILQFVYSHRVWGRVFVAVIVAMLPLLLLVLLDYLLYTLELALLGSFCLWHVATALFLRRWYMAASWLILGCAIEVQVWFIEARPVGPTPFVSVLLLGLLWLFKPDYYVGWRSFRRAVELRRQNGQGDGIEMTRL
ncbi:hypothetical protein LTR17_004457 [Elasticomyces elasticus]|nr:hypothetical protein LTR17_004457 [Elasticomyces elasticus]